VHGHNYRCRVTVEGPELDDIGLLVDFIELKRTVHSVIDRLDHQWLNELPPFDKLTPSAENIAKHICDEVQSGMTMKNGVRLAAVTLWETDTAYAVYRP
jgi:6-pyruvoyltetrahydropterin/6-carboxytetrahydropterin synthase